MLSNVTEGGRALLQTILLGQPQLRRTIASPDLDQLRQRVLASYHLGGLSKDETQAYVEHRMRAVGWTGTPSWEQGALDLVYRYSSGIPRRINRLCARVLLGGALEHAQTLTAPMVEVTARELEEDLTGGPSMPRAPLRDAAPHHAALHEGGATVPASVLSDLSRRIEMLEMQAARRERLFNRLMDLFSGLEGRR